MEGVDDPSKPELRGIMLNVFDFIFDQIQDDNDHQREYLVYISYLEIYNEEIRDLLAKNSEKLQLKEGSDKGVYVKGLKKVWLQHFVGSVAFCRCKWLVILSSLYSRINILDGHHHRNCLCNR